ncbi:MAG: hypothetical protein KAS75_00370 [Planctomycetes bacterium]|nr:hypothetical protein [Planctomycetota bacterium]
MAWSGLNEKKEAVKKAVGDKFAAVRSPAEKGNRDLQGGMELLEVDFLLSIVENTAGNDANDVAMRKLNFEEILRRGKQGQIESSALVVYAVNAGSLYGKVIQCAATSELSKRTK